LIRSCNTSLASINKHTESEVEKDIRALLHFKRDGKVVVENIKPKVTGGVREVVDTQYAGSAQFKETVEGRIK
jgi:hypothetical protein